MLGRTLPFSFEPANAVVSRETHDRLGNLAGLVSKWTATINLVATGERDAIWSRHILDSLRLVPLIPPGLTRAIDLGSGAGFPGLVLAIATGVHFDLIEADQRKAAFLREAQRLTNAPVTVHCVRIEAADCPPASLVTARALAPLITLLSYAHGMLAPGGLALFPKGHKAEVEIAEARRHWTMNLTRYDDPACRGSTILGITGLARA